MSGARHQLVTDIFHGALDREPADREGYLSDACQGDASLRAEVEDLLRADAGAGSFLEEPAVAVADDPPTLQPGTMVGRYCIEALIGAGGMGEVYRARDTALPRSVAIKVMTAQARGNASLQARFETEAHAIAALNHARICTLYDVVRHGEVQCLVMEYVEGGSLHDRIKRGPLSIGETMRYAREVAEALAVAHQRGFVHRDIKPSNIMITADGHVKVVDFGLARLTALFNSEDVTRIRHSEPGTVVGTPYYMSPEQARGALLDQRTDIFSLGVVIFECLTGHLPFDGEARDEYLQHLVSSEPHRVSEFRADAPLDLQHITARCLERDISKRLDSAGWLVAELDRSSGIGVPAGAVPKSEARHSVWVSAVLALVAAAAVWYWAAHRGVAPSSPNPQLRMFTTSAGVESDSRLSPDGEWVSFVGLDASGNRQLYMQQIDAATRQLVTVPDGYLQSYVWSEDGKFFACLLWHPKEKEQEWTVEIVPNLFAPDTPVRKWTIPELPRNAALLRWIGNALYFQVNAKSDRTVSLQRFDLNRAQLELIPGPWRGSQTRAFDVRQDGRRVVWTTQAGADQSDLWFSDLGSDVATPLTDPNDRSLKRFPLWKGTGDAVIYQSNRGNQTDLWEIDATTRKLVQITTDRDIERPESTSLNESVTFQLTSAKAALWNWNANRNGGTPVSDEALSDFAPTTSSDGGVLAFQRSLPSPAEGFLAIDTDLVLVAPARPRVRLEPTKKATGFAPALSRDGRVLVYLQRVEGKPGKFKLLATRMETGRAEEISSTVLPPAHSDFPVGWSEHNLSWSSPEDLYFVDNTGESNRFRLMHYRVGETPVPLPGTESSSPLTDVYASFDGASLAYLSYSVDASTSKRTYQLHQFDLRTGVDRVSREYAREDYVRLCGWLRGDNGWALTRVVSRNETDLTVTVMVSTFNRDGTLQQERPVDHVVPTGVASLIASHSELYLTRSIDGIHNLFALGISSHKLRPVSDNAVRDVSFGSVEPLGADDVVAVRHEKRADIYLLDARPGAGARKNPSP